MDDSFGDTADVLLAQEVRLQQLGEEKAALANENSLLGAAIESLQVQLRAAQKRAAEAEARAEAGAASNSRQLAAAQAAEQKLEAEAGRCRHKAANDRILLEQAERGRRDAEAALAAARQQTAALQADNADLRQRLAAAQRQVRQLESLQPFADSWQEQRRSEAALSAELDRANSRVQQLEGRCAMLESELQSTAAALAAARELADSRAGEGGQEQQQGQQRAGSLSLTDLCDLNGAASQFVRGTASSAQHSIQSGAAGRGPPSARRVLQQCQTGGEQRSQQQEQEKQPRQGQARRQQQEELQHGAGAPEGEGEEEERGEGAAQAALAERAQHLSLVEGLQQQLLEQQRQLAHLQLQQQVALGGAPLSSGGGASTRDTASALAAAEQGRRLLALQGELEKLQRRNAQLQSALADSSMQHSRAAAAAAKQAQELQQQAAQLQQERDEARQQLATLQAAAAALGGDGSEADSSGGGSTSGGGNAEQLEQLLEYATRCNAAVEQNAALLQEKKSWLEKLRAAEGEAERSRGEAQQLRLQHLQLLPCPGRGAGSGAAVVVPSLQLQQQRGREEELLQLLLEAQAAEAALRSVLQEAREEQVAACKALSSELRRVHALERLRISDMAEVQRLQRRLHDLQKECRQLYKALAAAQQQLAAGAGKRGGQGQLDGAWLAAAGQPWQQRAGSRSEFHIPAAFPSGGVM